MKYGFSLVSAAAAATMIFWDRKKKKKHVSLCNERFMARDAQEKTEKVTIGKDCYLLTKNKVC